MFCYACGHQVQTDSAKFCESCGVNLSSNSKEPKPLSFKEYMEKRQSEIENQLSQDTLGTMHKHKSSERQISIKSSKKKTKQEETVKINVGLVEAEEKQLKIKRSSLLPIDVKRSDLHFTVKNLGVQKQLAHNKHLREEYVDCEWVLLYPDFDLVVTLPGTTEPFTVEKYKECLGRPYSRVNLYICTMNDYEVCNDLDDNPNPGEDPIIDVAIQHTSGTDATPNNMLSATDDDNNAVLMHVESEPNQDRSRSDQSPGPIDIIDVPSFDVHPIIVEVEASTSEPVVRERECDILVQADANQRESIFQPVNLLVRRVTLLKDLITAFSDPSVLISTLSIKVKDSNGKEEAGEGRGVLRDVLTEFWCQFNQSLAVGASSKVPVIRHDYQKEQWRAVARILLYGYCTEGIFPISLSAIFISSCIHGEDSISEELLLEAFKLYVSEDEKELITECLENRCPLDSKEVMGFLGSYKCYRKPSEENIHEIICQLAHQELIQRPRYVSNCWSPVLQSLKSVTAFRNAAEVRAFYDDKKPTPKKVVNMLNASPGNEMERNAYDHLKRFVKSLGANVAAFLQFTTGASVMLDGVKLQVSFTEMVGLARRPVVHTCGPLLELPSTYQCYNELVEEFAAILQQKSSWTFDIV